MNDFWKIILCSWEYWELDAWEEFAQAIERSYSWSSR